MSHAISRRALARASVLMLGSFAILRHARGDTPLELRCSLDTAPNARAGYARASVSGRFTGDLDDLPARLYYMTKTMMDRMNVEFEYQVRHSLGAWLVSAGARAGAGGTAAADVDTAAQVALTRSAGTIIPETIPRRRSEDTFNVACYFAARPCARIGLDVGQFRHSAPRARRHAA